MPSLWTNDNNKVKDCTLYSKNKFLQTYPGVLCGAGGSRIQGRKSGQKCHLGFCSKLAITSLDCIGGPPGKTKKPRSPEPHPRKKCDLIGLWGLQGWRDSNVQLDWDSAPKTFTYNVIKFRCLSAYRLLHLHGPPGCGAAFLEHPPRAERQPTCRGHDRKPQPGLSGAHSEATTTTDTYGAPSAMWLRASIQESLASGRPQAS